eukprot:6204342-Pleurochrysis_carterae.AAC.1
MRMLLSSKALHSNVHILAFAQNCLRTTIPVPLTLLRRTPSLTLKPVSASSALSRMLLTTDQYLRTLDVAAALSQLLLTCTRFFASCARTAFT